MGYGRKAEREAVTSLLHEFEQIDEGRVAINKKTKKNGVSKRTAITESNKDGES